MRRVYLFILFAVPLACFSFFNSILPTSLLAIPELMDKTGFVNLFTMAFVPTVYPAMAGLPNVVWAFSFIWVFGVAFSRQMANDFSITGVYGFVRRGKISVWYAKQTGQLLVCAFFSSLLYIGTLALLAFAVTGGAEPMHVSGIAVFLLLYNLFCATLLLFLIAMAVNLLSIRFGGTVGLVLVYVAVLALIFLPLISYTVINTQMSGASWGYKDSRQNTNYVFPFPLSLLFWLNPFSSVIPNWHTSPPSFALYEYQHRGTAFVIDNLPKWEFCVVLLPIFALVAVLSGWFFLRKRDISLVDEESR
ncbi:MAG: hypothetical protein LBF64_02840 [Oscillospiraceae bacterium]|jgi:hypothetical protein|nr:hypothetical protein [Oscillospiraceae bacterium]